MNLENKFIQLEQIIHSSNIRLFTEVTSTSDWLLKKIEEDGTNALPFLAIALKQTAGRGRGDHQWWSPEGALLFSLGITWCSIGLTRRQSAVLSIRVAEVLQKAVQSVLNQRGVTERAAISPPNDIYIGGRKIAGVLIESPNPESLVIGIGVNINNSFKNAPEDLKEKTVSFYDLTGQKTDRFAFLADLLKLLMQKENYLI